MVSSFINDMKRFTAAVILPLLLFFVSCRPEEQGEKLIPISNKSLNDSASAWFAHFSTYPSDLSKLPIGVITSQTEELSVMERFLTADYFDNITGDDGPDGIRDFAGERFYLLLDQANGAYNEYFRDTAGISLLRDISIRNVLLMMGDEYYIIPDDIVSTGLKDRVKFLVNVPDASGLFCQNDIDTLLQMSGTGVSSLSLVNCGIKAALSGVGRDERCAIGVLSSDDLYRTGRYEELIREVFSSTHSNDKVQIFQQLSYGLDMAVDGHTDFVLPEANSVRADYQGPVLGTGDNDINVNMLDRYCFDQHGNSLLVKKKGKTYTDIQLNSPGNYARFHLVTLIEKHRRSGSRIPIEAIVLGNRCDAFLLDTLKAVAAELYNFSRDGQYIYRNSISKNLRFIDPIECLVKDSYLLLRNNRILALNTSRTDITSFLTIPSPSLPVSDKDSLGVEFTETYKFSRTPGADECGYKLIPFSLRYITPEDFSYTVKLFPEATRQIKKKLY